MRKTILLFAAFLAIACGAAAQTYNLVLFSEDGETFFAYVNGVKQNNKAESNVKITGLNSEALNIRLEFENKALPKLKQNMMPEPGFEHTVRIKKSMKGEYKMQYFGKVALTDAPKTGASEVAYHTSDNSSAVDESHNNSGSTNIAVDDNAGYNTSVTTTTTTQTVHNPDNVYLNMGMGGAGVNVSVNAGSNTSGGEVRSSTTTRTVTTTSSTTYNSTSTTSNPRATTQTQNAAASGSGCSAAMPEASYAKMKKSVEDKPFSDTKMSTAKLATRGNCLSVAQIKGICGLFSMDEDKLTYAKYAYDYTIEKGNYYQVSEIFSFSSTTDDFNKFLESR